MTALISAAWLSHRLGFWMRVVRFLSRVGLRGSPAFWWATRHAALAADWTYCDLVEPLTEERCPFAPEALTRDRRRRVPATRAAEARPAARATTSVPSIPPAQATRSADVVAAIYPDSDVRAVQADTGADVRTTAARHSSGERRLSGSGGDACGGAR